jgi:hypothetical protein
VQLEINLNIALGAFVMLDDHAVAADIASGGAGRAPAAAVHLRYERGFAVSTASRGVSPDNGHCPDS